MSKLCAKWDKKDNIAQIKSDTIANIINDNYDTYITDTIDKTDKFLQDPQYRDQVYCLHSFVPTEGAKPDDEGVYGFIKCRGAYSSEHEANERAAYIIREVDSYNPIQTAYVGRPFPIFKGKYIPDDMTTEINVQEKAKETISASIKKKREEERKDINDIKEREQRLLDESKQEYVDENTLDFYIMEQVKKANLVWTYIKTMKKLEEEIKPAIINTRLKIEQLEQSPQGESYKKDFYAKYMETRKQAGIVEDSEENFIKYLVEDVDIGF
jgi:hypothetical protein